MGEFGRPAADVGLVEHTFADAPEEAGHCAFEHVAARRDERRLWRHIPSEGNEGVLAAAGPMEEEEGRKARIGARLEAMNVGQVLRHLSPSHHRRRLVDRWTSRY